MTTYNDFGTRNRDMQDGAERHLWGSLSYEAKAGAYMQLRGTGTQEYDVPVINLGYGFNLPKDSNAEAIALADGSDSNQKMAFLTLPRDKQRQWKENCGGVQNPTDPAKALDFNPQRAMMREKKIALADRGMIEIDGNTIIIRAKKVIFAGEIELAGNITGKANAAFAGAISAGGAMSAGGNLDIGGSGAFNGLSTNKNSVKTNDGGGRKASPQKVSPQFTVPDFKDDYA